MLSKHTYYKIKIKTVNILSVTNTVKVLKYQLFIKEELSMA